MPPLHSLLVLGQQALQKGDLGKAIGYADQRLSQEPRDASAHELRYLAQFKNDDVSGAIESLKKVVELLPTALWAFEELVILLFETGQLAAAEHAARHALKINPLSPQSHNMMGMIFSSQNELVPGEWHYRRTLELGPRHPKLLANLALNLQQQGRLEESDPLFAEANKLEPKNPVTLTNWARLCEIKGDLGRAHTLLDEAEAELVEYGDDVGLARAILLSREKKYEQALGVLDRSRSGGDITLRPMRQLERGRLYDKLGRYDEAWRDFVEAKERMDTDPATTYDRKRIEAFFRQLKAFFHKGHMDLVPRPSTNDSRPQPIFIMGFPRSGTTMVEQVLNSHSHVQAGGELTYIVDMTAVVPKILGSNHEFPEALAETWIADKKFGIQVFRDLYLSRAAQDGILKEGRPFFTDKMPLNETFLPFISTLFPEAKFIHLIRHPLDIGLSVMSNYLTHGFYCGFGIDKFATHFNAVHDLVGHYLAQAKPKYYYPLRYETFVHNQREETEKLLEFLDLPFEENCISFHQNQRFANTASYAQVTEKLYDSSIGRYRHYVEHMKPILPIIGPAMKQLGYEV